MAFGSYTTYASSWEVCVWDKSVNYDKLNLKIKTMLRGFMSEVSTELRSYFSTCELTVSPSEKVEKLGFEFRNTSKH